MAFTGKENHAIALSDAVKLISAAKSKAAKGAVIGGFFGKEALQRVLDQDDCVGIRYYYAEKDDGTPTLVLAGVDKDENDLDQGDILEWSYPCPPFCGAANSLNS